jgi:endonuclease/exonuclease/phosphatase family metal-dependent hydrolase
MRPLALNPALLVVAGILGAGCTGRKPVEPQEGVPHLKVMTYNVNYGLAGDEDTIEAIRGGGAGIVLLQETTAKWEEALRRELSGAYPHMQFRHCCGAGGLAVLSRYPFEEKDYISSPSGWFPAWRVMASSPIGTIQVLAVHLHPPLSEKGSIVSGYVTTPKVRFEEIETFFGYLEPGLPTVIAGDFNEKSDGRAVKFLKKQGFKTALPEFHPGRKTWHWKTSIGTVKAQLDHILYNGKLEALDADVLAKGRSDHFPVVAVFENAPN